MLSKQQQKQPLTVEEIKAYAAQSRRVDEDGSKAQDDLNELYPKLHALNKDTSNIKNGLNEASEEERDDIDEEMLAAKIQNFIETYQNLSKEKNTLFLRIKNIHDQLKSIEKWHGAPSEAKKHVRVINKADAMKEGMLASVLREDEKKCNDILRQCGDHIQYLMSLFPEVNFDTLPPVITVGTTPPILTRGTDKFSEDEGDDAKAEASVQPIARYGSTLSTESTDSDDSDKLEAAPAKATRQPAKASAVHGTHLNKAKQANAAAKQDIDGPKKDNPDSQCLNCVIL